MKFRKLVEELIAVNGIGISREDMPQIPRAKFNDFLRYLSSYGVQYTFRKLPADSLKPSQVFIDSDKIGIERSKVNKPIVVSNDYFILDGHHGWASNYGLNVVDCMIIDLPISDLIQMAIEFE